MPHAHVEIHRPDGAAINPYWSLRQPSATSTAPSSPCQTRPARRGQPPPAGAGTDRPRRSGRTHRRRPPAAADGVPAPVAGTTRPGGPARRLAGDRVDGGDAAGRVAAADAHRRHAGLRRRGGTDVDQSRRLHAGRRGRALRVGDPRYDAGSTARSRRNRRSAVRSRPSSAPSWRRSRRWSRAATTRSPSTTSTASGAYQFLDSSWGGYGGYARAKDAPPDGAGRQGRRAGRIDPRPQRRRRLDDPRVVVPRPRARRRRMGHRAGVPGQPAHAAGVPGPLDEALRPAPRHARGLGRHDSGVLAGGGHLGHVPHRRRRRRPGRSTAVRADPGSGLRQQRRPAGPCPAPSIRAIRRGRWSHRHRWSSGRWCGSPDRPDHSRRLVGIAACAGRRAAEADRIPCRQ